MLFSVLEHTIKQILLKLSIPTLSLFLKSWIQAFFLRPSFNFIDHCHYQCFSKLAIVMYFNQQIALPDKIRPVIIRFRISTLFMYFPNLCVDLFNLRWQFTFLLNWQIFFRLFIKSALLVLHLTANHFCNVLTVSLDSVTLQKQLTLQDFTAFWTFVFYLFPKYLHTLNLYQWLPLLKILRWWTGYTPMQEHVIETVSMLKLCKWKSCGTPPNGLFYFWGNLRD